MELQDDDPELTNPRFLKLFKLIAMLRSGRWTIKQIAERFDAGKSTIYRYIAVLEQSGFFIEKDFHDRYFIITSDDDPLNTQFSAEEISVMRNMIIQGDLNSPVTGSILKKLQIQADEATVPRIFVKAHLGNMVEQLNRALRDKHQVVLNNYHSANSSEVRDRLVEPIHFGDNYNSIMALDTEDKTCKQFKLGRIGDVTETHKIFVHEHLHEIRTPDIFGFTSDACIWISLRLSLRAYLLLREEYPLSIPYLKSENNTYTFNGPVVTYDAIGRFVLGLIDEIEIIAPKEFYDFITAKFTKGHLHH